MLVAESLHCLPDPLEPVLAPRLRTTASEVLVAIGRALAPGLADDPAPAWLRPDQVRAFRRVVAAIRQHGGALLAEPVGTGKSWIALAAAGALTRHPIVVLAPAALVPQWVATTSRLGVDAVVHSHETLSRGRLPVARAGFVIVDESHGFREPASRRYRVLAPWISGRPCLLVSATPVVNRIADLGHQLRLCLKDDALAAAGLPSLRRMSPAAGGIEGLGEVVIAGLTSGGDRPRLRQTATRLRNDPDLGRVLRELDRLGLSTDPGVAALVRTSLWGAAASSPAALAAALLRYQALLEHARDAARSGQRLSREALRRFIAADPAQLVLWELLPVEETIGDLALGDQDSVTRLRAEAVRMAETPDPKLIELQRVVSDGRRTLVFTGSVATVGYLCRHLGPAPVAWCTGARAGIGATTLPRDAVLAWFAPAGAQPRSAGLATPRILVTTDVAAEGLDLQGAERVVHYDLPWTAVRTDQRTGRVHRLGSAHATVDAHWILPSRALAGRLGIERVVAQKRRVPGLVGIGEAASAWWRQRQEVQRELPEGAGGEGCAQLADTAGDATGGDAVACIRIESGPGRGVTRLLVHRPGIGWRPDEEAGLALLRRAVRAPGARSPDPGAVQVLVERLAEPVRSVLRMAAGRHWEPGPVRPVVARLLRRLRHWSRIAARARDARLLEQLDHAIRGLGGGLTAGEEFALARLATRDDASLQEHLAALPRRAPALALPSVRLVGLVAFGTARDQTVPQ